MFIKTILYKDDISKSNVELEAELQILSSNYGYSPKIHNVFYENDRARIVMEKIDENCLAIKYGKEFEDIPKEIWDGIRDIVYCLYEDEGIEYVDISAYNFIEKDGRLYIIDFEHAYYKNTDKKMNWFLEEFLDGKNEWNPDFF